MARTRSQSAETSWLRDWSLKHKLTAIMMLTCLIALSLAGAVFIAWEYTNLRRTMVLNLTTHADVLAENCKAAITFEDSADAKEVLSAVQSVPSILATCIYTKDNHLFAAYTRPETATVLPHPDRLDRGHAFTKDRLTVAQPIMLEGEKIGTICIASELDPMYAMLKKAASVIGGIFLISALAAYIASSKLQRIISAPILHLSSVARMVSERKEYALRAEQHGHDEVGKLVDAFNGMLEQIQERDAALVTANEQLEAHVQERTGELQATNERLTKEVTIRKRAEQILKSRTEQILHHQKTLVNLSRYGNDDLLSAIRRTTRAAAKTLSVERVSVWFLNNSTTALACEDLYTLSQDTHESGAHMKVSDYRLYFQAIEASRVIAADNARADSRTVEFVEDYLIPLGITSMLQVPIRLHGKTLGVLCHEHVKTPRRWSLEEQDFGVSLADMIALQVEANERRKAERALGRANKHLADTVRELRRSNKELQDFAYVTAHDLKAPLRGIGTLADWIVTDYTDKLDAEGQEQLKLLKGRVSRMSELIDSILHYSEIGRTTKHVEKVDLNVLVPEAVAQLAVPDHIHVTIEDDLPTVVFEKVRLIQIFQNLIGNAVKYMDKPEGRIEIGCASDERYWTFSVKDNGPGIESKYFEKIFAMFQTLTRRDELESTGIGLAVVKKIVDLYDGAVWLESEVGQGTTFYFTLPRQPENAVPEAPTSSGITRGGRGGE